MQHRRAGFTLVEILTVVIIIALLSAVGLLAYNAIQTDTNQRQADGLSRSLRAGMEAYYRKNGEYPSVPTLTGGAVNGTGMTDTQYRSIGTLLNVPSTALNKSRFIFVPCEATTCTNIQNTSAYANTVYYITRSASDTVSRTVAFGSCSVVFAGATSATSGPSSYVIAFRKPDGSDLIRYRSAVGDVSMSTGGCSFNS